MAGRGDRALLMGHGPVWLKLMTGADQRHRQAGWPRALDANVSETEARTGRVRVGAEKERNNGRACWPVQPG